MNNNFEEGWAIVTFIGSKEKPGFAKVSLVRYGKDIGYGMEDNFRPRDNLIGKLGEFIDLMKFSGNSGQLVHLLDQNGFKLVQLVGDP